MHCSVKLCHVLDLWAGILSCAVITEESSLRVVSLAGVDGASYLGWKHELAGVDSASYLGWKHELAGVDSASYLGWKHELAQGI